MPAGDTIADYNTAEDIARQQCSWGSATMEYGSLRSAAHTPPKDWDFDLQGPWSCSWCEEAGRPHNIWTSWAEFAADVVRLKELKLQSADDRAVKKLYDGEMKRHADGHGDQLLYEPPVVEGVDMDAFIVDPLHCLLLNLPKTAWKYSFGDRMNSDQRERAAAYLSSIGLHLDIREKGKRDPQQKWFSGAQFDEFVLGPGVKKKSKSPGLACNILALIEIVFDQTAVDEKAEEVAAAAAAESATAAAAKKQKAVSRKQRQGSGPAGGFGAGAVQEDELQRNAAAIEEELDLKDLDSHDE